MNTEAEIEIEKLSFKGLNTLLNKKRIDRKALLVKKEDLDNQLRDLNKIINRSEKMLRLLKSKGLVVSEHAILRFIERVESVCPKDVPDRILSDRLREMVTTLGNGKYPVDDFFVVVRDNVIITVTKD